MIPSQTVAFQSTVEVVLCIIKIQHVFNTTQVYTPRTMQGYFNANIQNYVTLMSLAGLLFTRNTCMKV